MAANISTIPSLAGVIDAKIFCYRRAAFMCLGEDVSKRTVTCYDKVGALLVACGRVIYLAPAKNLIHPSFADLTQDGGIDLQIKKFMRTLPRSIVPLEARRTPARVRLHRYGTVLFFNSESSEEQDCCCASQSDPWARRRKSPGSL